MKKIFIVAIGVLLMWSACQTKTSQQLPAVDTTSITIHGLVEHPFIFRDSLVTAYSVATIDSIPMICRSGERKGTIKNTSSIKLKELILKAGPILESQKKSGEYYIILKAKDDYNVVISYNELFYTSAGDSMMILFYPSSHTWEDGPFVFTSATDRINGPRHVKWLNEIEVKRLNENER